MKDKKNKELQEISERLEKGVRAVFSSDAYKDYLNCMSKFHSYSTNNIVLIHLQNPGASLVAGYKTWKSKFNRQVRRGERGISILAPCSHKREIETEDGEIKEVVWTSFRAVKVFDISQTDGEELPSCVSRLTGDVKDFDELKDKLARVSPVSVRFDEVPGSANGYYDHSENIIVVQDGMSQQQTIKTLVHEIAHATLHGEDGEEKDATQETREVEAESVAYCVCAMLGLDTADYSFGYVAGWSSDKDVKELSASLEVIRKTASHIYDGLVA